VLTFAGYATLWGAIAADVGASLLVVMNALRLLQPGGSARKVPRAPVGRAGEPISAGGIMHVS
jgi:Cd2+/Zn2+-exporting ATPase